jgi:hypothetical protein
MVCTFNPCSTALHVSRINRFRRSTKTDSAEEEEDVSSVGAVATPGVAAATAVVVGVSCKELMVGFMCLSTRIKEKGKKKEEEEEEEEVI